MITFADNEPIWFFPAGWGGQGLGAEEQGIVNPVEAADVRDKMDMHKGIGMDLRDPFEQFRKNKSQGFIQRMKTRDEEKRMLMYTICHNVLYK